MLFNSYIFIFVFLPLALLLYFGFHRFGMKKAAGASLFLMSLWFYGYLNPSYLPVILISILVNFCVSKVLEKNRNKVVLVGGLGFNLGLLFYFKYYDFFISNINSVFKTDFNLLHIALPLGISFFTFQQISYCIDAYRGETADYSFLDYCVFVAFFPQLVAGPIVLHEEMLPQFRDEKNYVINAKNMSIGLHAFAVGLAKKVIIADTLGVPVTLAFGGVEILSSADVLLTTLCYCLQLYFDFSGYCDMAYGIAKMFNIDIPANFNSPYKATSILDFWKRWHITLTRFLRKYVYFPLGGSRRGNVRTYINVFIVFLLSGIWHGANWTFVLWGVMHGVANVINRLWVRRSEPGFRGKKSRSGPNESGINRMDKQSELKDTDETLANENIVDVKIADRKITDSNKIWKAVGWFFTFSFVAVAFLIFRADSVGQAYIMLRKVAKLESFTFTPLLLTGLNFAEVTHILSWFGLDNILTDMPLLWPATFILIVMGITLFTKNTREKEFEPGVRMMASTVVLLVWSVLSLTGLSTFLYFNF